MRNLDGISVASDVLTICNTKSFNADCSDVNNIPENNSKKKKKDSFTIVLAFSVFAFLVLLTICILTYLHRREERRKAILSYFPEIFFNKLSSEYIPSKSIYENNDNTDLDEFTVVNKDRNILERMMRSKVRSIHLDRNSNSEIIENNIEESLTDKSEIENQFENENESKITDDTNIKDEGDDIVISNNNYFVKTILHKDKDMI